MCLLPGLKSIGKIGVQIYRIRNYLQESFQKNQAKKTKELKQSPAANLAVTLAGRLPGLTTLQTSGEPGRDVTALFIRGRATINQTAPIVLIDGIERDLTHIDPNEVESITILKDASSTAISSSWFIPNVANTLLLVWRT